MGRLRWWIALGIVEIVTACGSGTPSSPPQGSASVPDPMFGTAPLGTTPCARLCTKALRCLGVSDNELAACVTSCAARAPDEARVAQLEAADCAEVVSVLQGAAGAGAAPRPTPAGNGCAADCTGCVGDGTSCYAVAGGANGIPCEPCCCAPGGPAPTWKTE
ncbi:MAG: hypothetical protein NT062_27760 [Proteobacteria bacterium]|nr:hypothetical protein [Pseudomonadota bacterium]